MTTVGPHRDDLLLEVGGRRLREYGSTGQQLLNDVFAELDRERQSRLALRLLGPEERQVFITTRGLTSCRRIWICRGGAKMGGSEVGKSRVTRHESRVDRRPELVNASGAQPRVDS